MCGLRKKAPRFCHPDERLFSGAKEGSRPDNPPDVERAYFLTPYKNVWAAVSEIIPEQFPATVIQDVIKNLCQPVKRQGG